MPKTLIAIGVFLVVLGLLWPLLSKIGLGRPPGRHRDREGEFPTSLSCHFGGAGERRLERFCERPLVAVSRVGGAARVSACRTSGIRVVPAGSVWSKFLLGRVRPAGGFSQPLVLGATQHRQDAINYHLGRGPVCVGIPSHESALLGLRVGDLLDHALSPLGADRAKPFFRRLSGERLTLRYALLSGSSRAHRPVSRGRVAAPGRGLLGV
jgi:hypothetical protein